MIPKECKRLAEVDFPIAVVSKHSAREKSIRHGHPSTLHLWWARRPLAACRAMLLALLLPDPDDRQCPADFKENARALLGKITGRIGPKDLDLRAALLHFIGDFADWDNSSNPVYLEIGRGLVKAAHPEETPLVVDPFVGGGSIPLEALRLGCDAFASDLNPVACLINKVQLEDIPRHGPELADALRKVGAEVKIAVEKESAEFYPCDPDGARPIAYLWARTIRCEAPNCGAEIPLMRSFWLCKKAERRRALRAKVVRPAKNLPGVEFELFTPATEKEVRGGTVSRAKATCVCCNLVLHPDRVRAQLAAQRGGADVVFDAKGKRTSGATLLAVVTLCEGQAGRHYRLPTDADYKAVWKAQQRLKEVATTKRDDGLSAIPDETVNPIRPSPNARGLSAVTRYGILSFGDMFSRRQALAVWGHANAISKCKSSLVRLVAFGLSKLADLSCSLCRWEAVAECPRQLFSRHAAAMTWDFAEGVPTSSASGSFETCVANTASGVASIRFLTHPATVAQADASESPLPTASVSVVFTDPPYYDAIPYADLSDFFFVWLKRAGVDNLLMRDPYDHSNTLTPKVRECVWNQAYSFEGKQKTGLFFEHYISSCFAEARRLLTNDGICSVVFAHSTTEAWESLLNGLIRGGWTISSSWPIATEMASRLRARETAALATSVHLVCRPRPEDAPVGDWGQVLRELPRRVADWMNRLQEEGVRGADLVFACIGPALEIFSRYPKVVDAEDREIPLGGDPEAREPHQRGYLAYVWEVVGRMALEQVLGTAESRARNGGAGALEEDARLTALFLWTLQATTQDVEPEPTTGEEDELDEPEEEDEEEDAPASKKKKKKGLTLPFDVARRFAQPLGIHLDAWEGRCIETVKGVVRLIPVLDRARQLFGDDGAEIAADRIEKVSTGPVQLSLFPDEPEEPRATPIKGRKRKGGANVSDEALRTRRGATTLDHVHAAMLLQAAGRANALRALLKTETERGPAFLRLANALSALYPKDSEEKRLLDAMLLAVPR